MASRCRVLHIILVALKEQSLDLIISGYSFNLSNETDDCGFVFAFFLHLGPGFLRKVSGFFGLHPSA
jgi:hypothetical protein